ncbi:MAG TPA: hypothetical protein VJK30_07595 [Coxiellaceae bacterium]|nr:hypothetical protein [Coxiellaceae bacterium]
MLTDEARIANEQHAQSYGNLYPNGLHPKKSENSTLQSEIEKLLRDFADYREISKQKGLSNDARKTTQSDLKECAAKLNNLINKRVVELNIQAEILRTEIANSERPAGNVTRHEEFNAEIQFLEKLKTQLLLFTQNTAANQRDNKAASLTANNLAAFSYSEEKRRSPSVLTNCEDGHSDVHREILRAKL